jgi:phage terminase small subunit
MGHVGEVDLAVLTLWAKAHATAIKAYADVRKRGQILAGVRRGKGEDGQRERVINRSVQIARDYSALARNLAAELGMTPAGRVGMTATAGPKVPGSLGALLGDEPAEEA